MPYNAFQDAAPASAEDRKAAKCTFDKDADFYLLTPHFECFPDGEPVGKSFLDYHLNHFACAFTLSDYATISGDMNKAARIMTHRFYRNFCEIFSEDNIARVHIASRARRHFTSNVSNEQLPYGDMEVVEFHIGGNLSNALQDFAGFVHPDFVGLERFFDQNHTAREDLSPLNANNDTDILLNGIQSFCGNTLYRNWNTPLEKIFQDDSGNQAAKAIINAVKSIGRGTLPQDTLMRAGLWKVRAGLGEMIDLNRQHFLAGTRSWCVGVVEGATAPTFFVETAAFERNSSVASLVLEDAMGSRDDINLLWEHQIKNFLGSTRISGTLPVPVPVPKNYVTQGGYSRFSLAALEDYAVKKNWEFASKEALNAIAGNAFMKQIFNRHPGLRRHIPPTLLE